MIQLAMSLSDCIWMETKDGDDSVRSVYDRHYTRRSYKDGRRPALFVGPGEKMVLRTASCEAIFVWRKFISMDNQEGINCSIFRNEGAERSSNLILEACKLAWERWPGERLYTYVNPRKIRSSNPGFCFLSAGWTKCGKTKKGLIVLNTRGGANEIRLL